MFGETNNIIPSIIMDNERASITKIRNSITFCLVDH